MNITKLVGTAVFSTALVLGVSHAEEKAHQHDHEAMDHSGHDHHGMAKEGKDHGKKGIGSPEVKQSLGQVLDAYLPLQTALVESDKAKAEAALKALELTLEKSGKLKADKAGDAFAAHLEKLGKNVDAMQSAGDLETMRREFSPLSRELIATLKHFGYQSEHMARIAHCPMALKEGADWIQSGEKVMNPYYGDKMLHCGSIQSTI